MAIMNLTVVAEHKTATIVINTEVEQGDEESALQAIQVAARETAFRLGFALTPEGVHRDEQP